MKKLLLSLMLVASSYADTHYFYVKNTQDKEDIVEYLNSKTELFHILVRKKIKLVVHGERRPDVDYVTGIEVVYNSNSRMDDRELGHYDGAQIKINYDRTAKYNQFTVVHEMLHALGHDHIKDDMVMSGYATWFRTPLFYSRNNKQVLQVLNLHENLGLLKPSFKRAMYKAKLKDINYLYVCNWSGREQHKKDLKRNERMKKFLLKEIGIEYTMKEQVCYKSK